MFLIFESILKSLIYYRIKEIIIDISSIQIAFYSAEYGKDSMQEMNIISIT